MNYKFKGKIDVSEDALEKILEDYADSSLPCPIKNGWVYGNLINGKTPYIVGEVVEEYYEGVNVSYWFPVKKVTVGQYTGLKIIHGTEITEIYEGDILKCRLSDGKYENYLVEFENHLEWFGNTAEYVAYNKDRTNFMSSSIWHKFEIIGNIHDNPELLEETE